MVFVEANAREIDIPNARRTTNLEAWTGGDFLVSTLGIPILNKAILNTHLEANALIVQCKRGDDLASSVGDRLNDSLARMHGTNTVQAQRVLLFIGILTCNSDGKALINGRTTHNNSDYWTVQGSIEKWCDRGGVYRNISRESLLSEWCAKAEKRLREYDAHGYKYVYSAREYPDALPASDDALQLPVRVRDGRVTLLQLPGLGIELVERVWAYCGSLKTALNLLTDVGSAGEIEGIGVGKIKKIREYCGLVEGDAPLNWYNGETQNRLRTL